MFGWFKRKKTKPLSAADKSGLYYLGSFGNFGALLVAYSAGTRAGVFNYSDEDAAKDYRRLVEKYGGNVI